MVIVVIFFTSKTLTTAGLYDNIYVYFSASVGSFTTI